MGLRIQAGMCAAIRTHLQNLQEAINVAVDMGIKVEVSTFDVHYIQNKHDTPQLTIKTYIELNGEVENG